MKKIIFIILLISSAQLSFCQSSFDKVVKLYYRVNPYDRKFSTALNNILSDTSFVKTSLEKRTDSSFFFLSGYYKHFGPFDFKTSRTELRLAEIEITYNDSPSANDTIIIYQVLGIAESGEDGKATVQKEFNRFHRRFSRDFAKSDYKEGKSSNGEVTAAIYNYFFNGYQVSPLSVAWGKMPGENSYTFTISLRIKVKENFAGLPKSPQEQKRFP